MIELPEALCLAQQLNKHLSGHKVAKVLPPVKPHRFCWFSGDSDFYQDSLMDSSIKSVQGFGIFVEITFDNGKRLCFNDGVNPRLISDGRLPKNYQLALVFESDAALVFTVAMYGSLLLHNGDCDNQYYHKSLNAISPFGTEFAEYFMENAAKCGNISAKGFLATEQRFPGLGNGVLQDILFKAAVNPKSKIGALSPEKIHELCRCTAEVLRQMRLEGGRDTEKDIFGAPGGYQTVMSKNTYGLPCPGCGGRIVKETYMGGSVYYCPVCQPLVK